METLNQLPIDEFQSTVQQGLGQAALSLSKKGRLEQELFHLVKVFVFATGLTIALFLVLPFLQTMSKPPSTDLIVQTVDTANLPPPPPPMTVEPEKQQEQEQKPPELTETPAPLDLSQLEMALNPAPVFGDGWLSGDFAVKLNTVTAASGAKEDVDALFTMADLDQMPRIIYQPGPVLSSGLRNKLPGMVYVLFIVNESGRVESPLVQKSSDSVFEPPAVTAVKQWKFEPGKRNGKPVRFRMRVPINFPKV